MTHFFHLKVCFVILCVIIQESHAFAVKKFEPKYKKVLKLSLLFYEAQRSGRLPETNRIPWRGDSALQDKGVNGEDLTGGYYDAGDYVKFSYTMAFTTTLLAWGMISFKDGYEMAGQYSEGLEAIKWATDYFVKCHTSKYEFYGQVGSFDLDHVYWGRPEDMNMTRPAYKIDKDNPGSDLASEASAALAASSILFKGLDEVYTRKLLKHAEELYDFAKTYRGLYHGAIPGAKAYYESSGYGDSLVWAAIWLYKATENSTYLNEAERFYSTFRIKERPNEFFYNKKVAGVQVLLGETTKSSEYMQAVKNFCDFQITNQQRTPNGLVYIDKAGTLSLSANVAFICLQAARLNISTLPYVLFAKEQIDYILGSTNRSFVVGYGKNYPKRPHHASSSCPAKPKDCGWKYYNSTQPNPQVLYGALVSGPDRNDRYEDDREEFLYNEVTLDYNAGFQGALAGLIHYKDTLKIINK